MSDADLAPVGMLALFILSTSDGWMSIADIQAAIEEATGAAPHRESIRVALADISVDNLQTRFDSRGAPAKEYRLTD